MINADDLRDANPWHPITNSVDLKTLGKFAEELNECATAVSRCIIQGINECEPVTNVVNKDWLQDEIADVLAGIELTIKRFKLDRNKINNRQLKKEKHLSKWHDMA